MSNKMPELPEVETLKCYLEQHISGKKINEIVVNRGNLRYPLSNDLTECCQNAVITSIKRVAKYIVMHLSNGYSLIIHLGMSGRFTVRAKDYNPIKHDHIIINLDDYSKVIFNDARRFGMIYCCKTKELYQQKFFKNLGPDPLTELFNIEYLQEHLKRRKIPIKNAIMDNKIVVGVGNIYACESLFKARINPLLLSNTLNYRQITALVLAIKEILQQAISAGGTTLKDFVSGDNKPGYFKQELQIYGRYKEKCYTCNSYIDKVTQSGRTSFFCPNCQKL
jgi:formamidopyrimidine-DNA glycosylase